MSHHTRQNLCFGQFYHPRIEVFQKKMKRGLIEPKQYLETLV